MEKLGNIDFASLVDIVSTFTYYESNTADFIQFYFLLLEDGRGKE